MGDGKWNGVSHVFANSDSVRIATLRYFLRELDAKLHFDHLNEL